MFKMKVILVIFVVGILANHPNNAENPLTVAHSNLLTIFGIHKVFIDAYRGSVTNYSYMAANQMINIITNEIEQWRKRNEIFWNTEETGEAIRICVNSVSIRFSDLQVMIYGFLEEVEEETQEILLLVMRELREFNIVENYDDFYYHALEIGDEIDEKFFGELYPNMVEATEGMFQEIIQLPEVLMECLNGLIPSLHA